MADLDLDRVEPIAGRERGVDVVGVGETTQMRANGLDETRTFPRCEAERQDAGAEPISTAAWRVDQVSAPRQRSQQARDGRARQTCAQRDIAAAETGLALAEHVHDRESASERDHEFAVALAETREVFGHLGVVGVRAHHSLQSVCRAASIVVVISVESLTRSGPILSRNCVSERA